MFVGTLDYSSTLPLCWIFNLFLNLLHLLVRGYVTQNYLIINSWWDLIASNTRCWFGLLSNATTMLWCDAALAFVPDVSTIKEFIKRGMCWNIQKKTKITTFDFIIYHWSIYHWPLAMWRQLGPPVYSLITNRQTWRNIQWAPPAHPPSAQSSLLVISGSQINCGQSFTASPLAVFVLIAAK